MNPTAGAASSFDLQVTEIWFGQDGTDVSEDWFEITNDGSGTWTASTDGNLYYDDDSSDASAADLVNGISSLAAGEVAVVVVGSESDATTFRSVWEQVIDLSSIQVGWTEGSGLGDGGDGVTLFIDDEDDGVDSSDQVEFASYPDGSGNSGQSYDVTNEAFSVDGQNGAVSTLTLGGAGAEPAVGSPGNGNAVITTTLAIAATDAVKAEGDSGNTSFTFTVTRSGDTTGTTDVDYAVTSSAADATDFGGSLPSGTVSFATGETTQTITINVSGDTDFESDESFTVTLSNATNGATLDTADATGTIQNDDVAPFFDLQVTEIWPGQDGDDLLIGDAPAIVVEAEGLLLTKENGFDQTWEDSATTDPVVSPDEVETAMHTPDANQLISLTNPEVDDEFPLRAEGFTPEMMLEDYLVA